VFKDTGMRKSLPTLCNSGKEVDIKEKCPTLPICSLIWNEEIPFSKGIGKDIPESEKSENSKEELIPNWTNLADHIDYSKIIFENMSIEPTRYCSEFVSISYLHTHLLKN